MPKDLNSDECPLCGGKGYTTYEIENVEYRSVCACRKGEVMCTICNDKGYIENQDENGITRTTVCKCIQDMQARKRTEFAKIPEKYNGISVSDFKTDVYSNENIGIANVARHIAAKYVYNFEELKAAGKGLYLYSNAKGSGKTMLSIAIGNALGNKYGIHYRFITTVDLIDEIRKTFHKESKRTESEIINLVSDIGLLILDDVGVERPTDFVKEKLNQIINRRVNDKKITIITSNIHMSQLPLDERTISRLKESCIPVNLPEESIREKKAEEKNLEFMKMLLE